MPEPLPTIATRPALAACAAAAVGSVVLIVWGFAAVAPWNDSLDRLDGEVTANLTAHESQKDDYQIKYTFQLEPGFPRVGDDDRNGNGRHQFNGHSAEAV